MDLAFHAVVTTYVQFFGYGTGVMEALGTMDRKK